jgi:hypothetical protein
VKLFLGICILVSLAGGLWAAELEPGLDKLLQTAPPDSHLSVIVKLFNPHDIAALDHKLHVEKAPLALRHKTVIAALKDNAERTQGPVLARLDRMKDKGAVVGYTAYWIENLIVVLGNSDAIRTLASDPAVESIGSNFKAELIEPVRGPIRTHDSPNHLDNEVVTVGQNATGATRVNRELGITGHNRLIGGLDTGVMGSHVALHDRWRGLTHPLAECWLDLLGSSPAGPTDGGGHGTHTMGTMCGRAIVGTDTVTVGAAPDAEWIACNAINQGVGSGFDQDILDAYQWFTDPDGNPNTIDDLPDVIHNSWGVAEFLGYPTCFNNWNTAITNCEAAGPVVTWSAGNEGPGAQTLRSPAKYELSPTDIFSIGAVDLSSDSVAPYPIAGFSSRGPSGCDPSPTAIKPEIVAPGVHVYSSYNSGGYTFMDGTSMAGPHVAGIVALMREACPNCDAQTIKETLIATANDSGYAPAGDDNTFGHGFVDAYAAVLAVYNLGRIDGYVTLSGGNPIAGVRVQTVGGLNYAMTNASGYYNLPASAATYSVTYSKFGYQTTTQNNVVVVQGDTTHVSVTMSLVPSGVLQATVILQSGIAVAGADVNFPGTPLDTMVTNAQGQFLLTMPANTYATHISLTLQLTPPRTFTADTTVTITVGDTTHAVMTVTADLVEPSPADAYGYRAYDRYDRDLPCPYDWVELNPASGGHGTAFTYVQNDSARFFKAPFPISFYGWQSDSLTVNCNGWMLPGVNLDAGATDTPIPSNNPATPDPPGIIAPLWNNFDNPASALQFSLYDSVAGRWIFEFINQRLVSPNTFVNNWEVQFLDPALHPTRTGDGDILFLYGVVQYGSTSTVGIENPAETTGLQVQHDSTVAGWAWPIANGSAIRITTGLATQYGSATIVLSLNPPPPDGTSRTVIIGGRRITAPTPDALVTDSVPAVPVSAVLYMPGYEMARVEQVTINPSQMNTIFVDAWRLDTVREITPTQMNGAVTLQWRQPESVEYAGNAAVHYSVYRNDTLMAQGLTDTQYTDQPLANHRTVHYTVEVWYGFGHVMSAPVPVTIDLGVDPTIHELPTAYQLYAAYPNPFNPDTRIRLDLPMASTGRLDVYDLEGRLVRTLWNGTLAAGRYEYSWNSHDNNGRAVSSGLYFCRFSSPQYTATQKMMLVK